MRFHTIVEHDYEYRIKQIVKSLLDDIGGEKTFINDEDLLDYLDQHSAQFGRAIIDDMAEWTDNWSDMIDE